MDSRQDIAAKIRQRRKELRLSQEDLADLAGVARQTVSAWERNFFVPKGKNLLALGRALGVPVSFFVGEGAQALGEESTPGSPFALAPFAQIYDYAQKNAVNGTEESRGEAARLLRLAISELERANAPAGQ